MLEGWIGLLERAASTSVAVMDTEDEKGALLCVIQSVKLKKKSGGEEQACPILAMAMAYS